MQKILSEEIMHRLAKIFCHYILPISVCLLPLGLAADVSFEEREQEGGGGLYSASEVNELDTSLSDEKEDSDAYVKVLYEEGLRAYNKGDYDEAKIYIQELLSIEPGHEGAQEILARIKGASATTWEDELSGPARESEGEDIEMERIKQEIKELREKIAMATQEEGVSGEIYSEEYFEKERAKESALEAGKRKEEELRRALKKKEEEERRARERKERERQEEQKRRVKLEKDKKEKEQAEAKLKEEEARRQKAEAERARKEEAARQARIERERQEKERAEAKRKEEEARRLRAEAERARLEEARRQAAIEREREEKEQAEAKRKEEEARRLRAEAERARLEQMRQKREQAEAMRIERKRAEEMAIRDAKKRDEELLEFSKRQKEEERRLRAEKEQAKLKEKERLHKLTQSQYALGLSLYKEGRFARAIEELEKIKDIEPMSEYLPLSERYIRYAREKLIHEEERQKAELEKTRREEKRKALEAKRKPPSPEEAGEIAVRRLLREAKIASSERRYDEAIDMYKRVLEIEPTNAAAEELLDRAINSKIEIEGQKAEKKIDVDEKKMMTEVATKWAIPEEKTQPPASALEEKGVDGADIIKPSSIRQKLDQPVTVDFRDVDLSYVLNYLSDVTGINIIASDAVYSINKKVTLRMKDMPLDDAIKYIVKNQSLSYRIEEDAIVIVTPEELEREAVETRVYFLTKGTGLFTEFNESTTGVSKGLGQAGDIKKITTLKDILEESVPFPKDSKIVMDERSGALVITNTPSNLRRIEEILYHLNVTPLQILIEARFLDIDVTDLKDLGIEEKLNSPWDVHKRNVELRWLGPGVGGPVTQIASDGGVDFTAFSRTDGFNLTYQGVLTKPQFQIVLHALDEKSSVKTLSCPRVTTLNNETATIKVVDEFIYPTKYEVSLIQFDINGDGDYDDAGETEFANVPQNFITRDVGIVLKVTPSVGADKKTISLTLIPEVSTGTAGAYTYSGGVTLPKFTSRSLATSVVIDDGETAALGGLIKDTTTDTLTKVPLLGDLPALGKLFQKRHKSVERRNLLIFVTANIISSQDESTKVALYEKTE